MVDSLARRLAQYAHGFSPDAIPAACWAEARRRVVDSLGCALGAIASAPVAAAHAMIATATLANGATVLGSGVQTMAEWATFANGAAIRYLDFNDTYLSREPAHPSDNLAAILAVAQIEGRSGADVLAAMTLAYEIQCRLCDAASIRARGWDHVTYGAISSAIAAGWLMRLDIEQFAHAIALAATPNAALRQTRVGELSHWKGCAFANAARNGVFAATLARYGMTGPSQVFEGEMGFFKQVSGPFDLPPMGGQPGADGFMLTRTYIKRYPAEYHAQSAIEAALSLREQMPSLENGLSIEAIEIDSFDAAVDIIGGFAEHWRPRSRETADHSMPYLVAVALMDGDVTLASFSPGKLADPALLALIQKISIHRDAALTAGYPDGIPNRLRIRLTDGRTLEALCRYPTGHAKNPMNDAQVAEKFRGLAGAVFSPSQTEALLIGLENFADCRDLGALLATFTVAS